MRRLFSLQDVIGLAVSLGAVALVAALGGAATARSVGTWYQTLAKPAFTPPDWVFGPVWTALYVAMGIAAWLVWRAPAHPWRRPALGLHAAQLALNLGWSVLFFGLRQPALALAELAVLLIAVAATAVLFARIVRWAGFLMLPYVAWTAYALALNAGIVLLNA